MVTPLLTPPAPAESDAPARRRRWPWVVATTVAVLACALIAGAVWVNHYQPLYVTGFGADSTDAHAVRWIDNTFGSERRIVSAAPGSQVTIYATVAMQAGVRVPVELTSVASPFPVTGNPMYAGMAVSPVVSMRSTMQPGASQRYEPFEPIQLAPGQVLDLRITFTVPHCTPEVGAIRTGYITVTTKTLGLARTVTLPGQYAVSLQSTPVCESP
jgi:hypothetical protein